MSGGLNAGHNYVRQSESTHSETSEKSGDFHHSQKDDGELRATIEIGKIASFALIHQDLYIILMVE
jgi:hypothetical protein